MGLADPHPPHPPPPGGVWGPVNTVQHRLPVATPPRLRQYPSTGMVSSSRLCPTSRDPTMPMRTHCPPPPPPPSTVAPQDSTSSMSSLIASRGSAKLPAHPTSLGSYTGFVSPGVLSPHATRRNQRWRSGVRRDIKPTTTRARPTSSHTTNSGVEPGNARGTRECPRKITFAHGFSANSSTPNSLAVMVPGACEMISQKCVLGVCPALYDHATACTMFAGCSCDDTTDTTPSIDHCPSTPPPPPPPPPFLSLPPTIPLTLHSAAGVAQLKTGGRTEWSDQRHISGKLETRQQSVAPSSSSQSSVETRRAGSPAGHNIARAREGVCVCVLGEDRGAGRHTVYTPPRHGTAWGAPSRRECTSPLSARRMPRLRSSRPSCGQHR